MPNPRKPPQARPRQQPREDLRCAQCSRDPSAFRGASDHGLTLHVVQKHGGQQLTQETPVSRVTQSGRDGIAAAASAKAILHSETLSLAIPFWTVDNPDTRMQRPAARPRFSELPAGATRRPSTTARFRTAPIRDIVLTERDKQLLADLRAASSLATQLPGQSLEGAISAHQSRAVPLSLSLVAD